MFFISFPVLNPELLESCETSGRRSERVNSTYKLNGISICQRIKNFFALLTLNVCYINAMSMIPLQYDLKIKHVPLLIT